MIFKPAVKPECLLSIAGHAVGFMQCTTSNSCVSSNTLLSAVIARRMGLHPLAARQVLPSVGCYLRFALRRAGVFFLGKLFAIVHNGIIARSVTLITGNYQRAIFGRIEEE